MENAVVLTYFTAGKPNNRHVDMYYQPNVFGWIKSYVANSADMQADAGGFLFVYNIYSRVVVHFSYLC